MSQFVWILRLLFGSGTSGGSSLDETDWTALRISGVVIVLAAVIQLVEDAVIPAFADTFVGDLVAYLGGLAVALLARLSLDYQDDGEFNGSVGDEGGEA
ncbi:MAG: hypothetical protein AAF532_14015 [Planctomycetota bacterium]